MAPYNAKLLQKLLIGTAFAIAGSGALAQHAPLSPERTIVSDVPNLLKSGPAKSTPANDVAVVKATQERGTLRARAVDVDFSTLLSITAKARASSGPQLVRIPFFDDASMLVEISKIEATSSGGVALIGSVPGIVHSTVILVNNNDAVSFHIGALSKKYVIFGSAQTGFLTKELAQIELPDHPPTLKNRLPEGKIANESSQTAAEPVPAPTPQRDDGSTVDVMVVYSPAAKLAQLPGNTGTTAQMNANIDAQIALTNTIYANSNVVQRLRLVYKGEVNYAEINMDDDLDAVIATNDGLLDEVPIIRDLYKADIVSLWGVYNDYCGLGSLLANETSSFNASNAARAYNIVASPNCTSGNAYTFAHELGHNMGLRHDNFADNGTNTFTLEGSGTTSTVAYAHGYIDLINRFRTVMSYNDQCEAGGFSCTRIPHFSNPNISYNNSGSYAPAVNAITGNASNAHERQALNDTRDTVANYRQALASFTGPGVVALVPVNYIVTEDGTSVSILVGRFLGTTGAISVNFATANGTASAGSDFTTTTGTLTWADGDTAIKTITVPILQDTALEGRENFLVTLSGATGGASVGSAGGTSSSATVSIIDDDPDNYPPGGVVPANYVQATPTLPWSFEPDDGYLSPTSIRSAQVIGSSGANDVYVNSDLDYTDVFVAGNVTFAYRVSSLGTSFANLQLLVDNTVQFSSAGGDTGWQTATIPISAGTHTIKWRFRNRVSFPCANALSPTPPPNCQDRAWIDSVVVPLSGNTLSIIKGGNGAGVVSGTGINCGNDCIETVVAGTMVTLTATPDVSSQFAGWSGGGCSGTGTCTVTMNSSQNVTATFNLLPEVFPANCAFPAGFSTPAGSTAGWSVATDRKRTGGCSMKSDPIPNAVAIGAANATRARIQASGNFAAGTVSFYYNVASEAGYDCLRFLVDGVERAEMGACNGSGGNGGNGASGNITAWTQVSIPVVAGNRTFTWSYEKDNTVAAPGDAAWIDDVVLPATAPAGTLQFTAASASISEAGGSAVLSVSRTGGSAGAVSVAFATANGTATAGSDFTGQAGTLNWADGDTANKTITVPITNEGLIEANETFTITLSSPVGATLGAQTSITVTITNDDNATAPGAPVIGTATAGNGLAMVAFTPPGSDGGSAITGYTAQCSAIGQTTRSNTGPSSPITVSSMTNGITYDCTVTATNAIGTGAPSGIVQVTPSAAVTLTLIGVQSRKTHAATGTFDVTIDTAIAIGGLVTVEPRAIGAGHSLVFQFNAPVTVAGTPSAVDSSAAAIGSVSALAGGNEVVVTLTGMPDNRRATVSLSGVNGLVNDFPASMGFLVGDVNNSRSVNASDISGIKARSGQATSAANFRFDLNASGGINATDISAVKARSGLVLP